MIVDTSALMTVLRGEPDARAFEDILLTSDIRISAATLLELEIVAAASGVSAEAAELLDLIGPEVVPFDSEQARIARDGYVRFGKGRHPAGLNFGDCFAYALARSLDEPLLFKGTGFSRTDVKRVV